MVTRWSRASELQLKKAFDYIRKDSEILSLNPERFPPDKFKMNNDGSYRAFELHRYRISYVILKEVVLIVRLRHTAMSPLLY